MGKAANPILKLTEFCNFDCGFCRYAKTNKSSTPMPLDVAKKALHEVSRYNMANGASFAHIIFHGGEPLLWGKDNFRKLYEYERHLCSVNPTFRFFNSIQTNGYLIDDDWIQLFVDMEMSVGISYDGPGDLNSHFGKQGCVEIAKLVQTLDCNNVSNGILSVITNSHNGCAKAYYDFLREANIHNVGLCYCFDPDANETVRNDVLSTFLIELFDLYFYGDYELNIREFEDAILGVIGKDAPSCCNKHRTLCGYHFTVLPDGKMQFCDSYESNAECFGDIMNYGIDSYFSSSQYLDMISRAHGNYEMFCSHCDVLDICRGGCFRNDTSNGSNCFCETYKKLYDHIRKVVNSVMIKQ